VTLVEKFNAFFRVMDPEDNATGGGAASAVSGAMAASLVGMVARLSVGKKKMPESDAYYQDINLKAQALSGALLSGSNEDSTAFDDVMVAYRMPRTSPDEKAARSAAIQTAMAGATQVPLANAASCVRVMALAEALKGRSNTNAASDLDCAIYLAEAGFKGAISNAEINIDSMKAGEQVEAFRAQVSALKAEMGGPGAQS
jgi:formiminotetrahydrofolate cyclodeaminase